jgi:hypothetical protein
MKYHFITFATDNYIEVANEIVESAKNLGGFDTVKIFTLKDIDDFYIQKNSSILCKRLGAGYWIWKSYIILKYLYDIDKDDIVCYCDTMYLFTGKNKIQDISKNINDTNSNIIITHNKPNEPTYLEKEFTKGDAFYLMNANEPKYFDTNQVWGGFIILKNNFLALKIISEWFTYAQDERIVTDTPSIIQENFIEFNGNRHDQTIISIIVKKYNIPIISFPKDFLYNRRVSI